MTRIDDKYAAVGGEGLLGRPLRDEATAGDGIGRFRLYERGAIFWHPTTDAHEVHGAIAAKWADSGRAAGPLGYPLTDEGTAQRGGRFSHFVNGSIYWHPDHGAHPVSLPVRAKWESMGWESSIGFPVSDPVDVGDGELRQSFERAVVGWGPQRGVSITGRPGSTSTTKRVRVFPISWADLAPPPEYTLDFIRRYFFAVGEQITNPDGGLIPSSVSDYFAHVSDGNLVVTGTVDDWVRSSLNITDTPHYFPGVVWPARKARLMGASVTETFRSKGITRREDLMINGVMPDALVFFALDVWAGGGATRTLTDAKRELNDAGRGDLWNPAWDNFPDLPIVMVSLCHEVPQPDALADGTFARRPDSTQLEWPHDDVMHHELVHALLGQGYDIYGGSWQLSSWFELMGFTVGSDFPVQMGSYTRERLGYLSIEDLPRRSHRDLVIEPLDTHSTAFRLQNGPVRNAETLIVENRARWRYDQIPPPRLSNVLLAYSMDPQQRRVDGGGYRLFAQLITRPAPDWFDTWGDPDAPDLLSTGPGRGNTLNHLGEAWWELRNIRVAEDEMITVDLEYLPQDLLKSYLTATWSNGNGNALVPDVFGGPLGHVMMVDRSRPLEEGQRYAKVLSVHPNWVPGGSLVGRYQVAVPSSGGRLYLTVALAEGAAGSDGVTCAVALNGSMVVQQDLTLRRNLRTLMVDLSDWRGESVTLDLRVDAGPSANRDWVHLVEAVIVPTAEPYVDFVRAATGASYASGVGQVNINAGGGLRGSVRTVDRVALHTGVVVAGPILSVTPDDSATGYLQASFPVTIPNRPSVLRAAFGFAESARIGDVPLSVAFRATGGNPMVLVDGARLTRNPAIDEQGLDANAILTMAEVIPVGMRGLTGEITIRIGAMAAGVEAVYLILAQLTWD